MRHALRAAMLTLVATLALAGIAAAPAHAGGSQAVVIIDTGSGTYTRVISFDGTITGYDALVLAGAGPTTYGFAGQGVAICQLFGIGHAADGACLGTGDDPSYWAYYRSPGGAGGWQYSRGGAGATTVSDGDVEGWRFGAGGAPGFRSFCDVVGCGPPPAPAPEAGPPPAAGVTVGGVTAEAGSPGSAPTATAAPGTGADPTAAAGSGDPAAGDATTAPTTAGSVATDGSAGRTRAAERQALGARPVVAADDGGSGSPIGVLVAAALVALIGGVAMVLRRRGRASD